MMVPASVVTVWLGLSLLLSSMAWFSGRRIGAAFLPIAAMIAAFCLYVPLGQPIPLMPPAGDYTVIGADIEVDIAIYALLKDGNKPPVYWRLPYSTASANQLQGAKDGSADGTGVRMKLDGQGGLSFDGPAPVTGSEPKQADSAPAIQIP